MRCIDAKIAGDVNGVTHIELRYASEVLVRFRGHK